MPEISIVILIKNQEALIRETLKAVFGQEVDYDFEVIVIDSGSKDKTLKIVKEFPVNLVRISSIEFGHGKTRNLGVRLSNGNYVVFLNGDAIPKNKYWLENLVQPFLVEEKVAGVYSRIYPRLDCNPLDSRDILYDDYLFNGKIKQIHSFSEYLKMSPEKKRKFISFHTISCAVKKQLLLENPFEDVVFGEDLEWSKRMLERGFKIIFESSSIVVHSHNLHCSFAQTLKKYFDDTLCNQHLLKRWTFKKIISEPRVVIFKSLKDLGFIVRLKKSFLYKLHWIIFSPIMRGAEFVGICLAAFDHLPERLARKLSLVEEIRKR